MRRGGVLLVCCLLASWPAACRQGGEGSGVAASPSVPACDGRIFAAVEQMGDPARIEQTLSLVPAEGSCPRAQLVRALTLVVAGRSGEALRLLQELARAEAGDVETARLAAELLATELAAGPTPSPAAALEAAERAIALDPHARRALLVRLLLRGGPPPAAAAVLDDAAKLAAPRPLLDDEAELQIRDVPLLLVEVLTMGRPLPQAAGPRERWVVARLLRQVGLARQGMSQRRYLEWARQEAEGALAAAGCPAELAGMLRLFAAEISRDLTDFPSCALLLEPLLAAQPGDHRARFLYLTALNRLGRWEDMIRAGVPDGEGCPTCLLRLAEAYHKLGDSRSLPLLRELHGRMPRHAPTISLLGRSLIQHGELAAAVALLQEALDDQDLDLSSLHALSGALQRLGQTDPARRVARLHAELYRGQEERRRAEEVRGFVAASYAEAQDALVRGDLPRVEELAGYIAERAPGYPLLPLLRLALAAARGMPLPADEAQRFREAVAAANPWVATAAAGGPR